MAGYVVMEPPGEADGGDAVFVRDGFHPLAFLVPFLWFLFHRMWWEALAAALVAGAIAAAGHFAGLGMASPWLSLLAGLYFGLEAPVLRVAALERRGWRDRGIVEADGPRDAELRYLMERPVPQPAETPGEAARPWGAPRPASVPALGLFSYPGRG